MFCCSWRSGPSSARLRRPDAKPWMHSGSSKQQRRAVLISQLLVEHLEPQEVLGRLDHSHLLLLEAVVTLCSFRGAMRTIRRLFLLLLLQLGVTARNSNRML